MSQPETEINPDRFDPDHGKELRKEVRGIIYRKLGRGALGVATWTAGIALASGALHVATNSESESPIKNGFVDEISEQFEHPFGSDGSPAEQGAEAWQDLQREIDRAKVEGEIPDHLSGDHLPPAEDNEKLRYVGR